MVSSVISAMENCGATVHNHDSLLMQCNCLGNACDVMGQSKSTLALHKRTRLKTEFKGTLYFYRELGFFQ